MAKLSIRTSFSGLWTGSLRNNQPSDASLRNEKATKMITLDPQALNQSLGPVLLGILLRSSALIIAGGVLVRLLRSRTAELRHFVCHGVLYGLLLLPVIECAAPPIRHP